MLSSIEIVDTTALPAAVIRVTAARDDIQAVMDPAIRELIQTVAAQGIGPAGPLFSRHFQVPVATFDFELGVPVNAPPQAQGRVRAGSLPAARVARVEYRGPYEQLGAAWTEFGERLRAEGLPLGTGFWECYIAGPESSADPEEWRTQLNRTLL